MLSVSHGYKTFAQDASATVDPSGTNTNTDTNVNTGRNTASSAFRSEMDDLLTIERISVMPFTDNLEGIYARPLESYFISLVEGMHRWNYVPARGSGPLMSPEEYEASPEKVRQAIEGLNADAFFVGRAAKGPNGITIHLSLLLAKDGKLLSQAILKDYKQVNLSDLKEQTQRLLTEMVARLPYTGRVLSREANRVTVNLGARDGLQKGQMLSVIQIIKAQRHPKFNFLVNTEKEIFGKIRVLKVDDTLSFGVVVSEKERGAIQKNSKIGPLDFVVYAPTDSLSLTPTPEEALSSREDSGIAFGKNARAWQPVSPASFGQLGVRLGLGQFDGNTQVEGVGGLGRGDNFAASITIDGEIWITPDWTFHGRLTQGVSKVDNARSGSTPEELNQSLSHYEAGIGYTLRFGPHAWSASVGPFLGAFYHKLFVDNASPEAHVTATYSGLMLGLRGSAPLEAMGAYGIGGQFAIALNPGVSEAPVPSGDQGDHNVIQFGVSGFKRLRERLKAQVNLDFEMYTSNFSGAGGRTEPASSTSQRFTTLSAGIYYLF